MLNPVTLGREFILQHDDQPYDPVKAHEYYLRTRELQGRVAGSLDETTSNRAASISSNTAQPITSKAPLQDNSSRQIRDEAHMKLLALKDKLAQLRKILTQLTKEAKARSTKTSATSAPDPASSQNSATKKELTPQQKDKAAKAAKDYYEKHKNDLEPAVEKQISDAETKIKEIQAKIEKLQKQLALKTNTSVRTPN